MQPGAPSEEVIFAAQPIVSIGHNDIESLKEQASLLSRKRKRICAHGDVDDALHEMIIVHERGTYVRPHKHLGKSESFHIVEGEVDVVLFDETGKITHIIEMGTYPSGRVFYYRINQSLFHSMLIVSPTLVFHETTSGPFRREDTVFPPWAPEEEKDPAGSRSFVLRMETEVARMRSQIA